MSFRRPRQMPARLVALSPPRAGMSTGSPNRRGRKGMIPSSRQKRRAASFLVQERNDGNDGPDHSAGFGGTDQPIQPERSTTLRGTTDWRANVQAWQKCDPALAGAGSCGAQNRHSRLAWSVGNDQACTQYQMSTYLACYGLLPNKTWENSLAITQLLPMIRRQLAHDAARSVGEHWWKQVSEHLWHSPPRPYRHSCVGHGAVRCRCPLVALGSTCSGQRLAPIAAGDV